MNKDVKQIFSAYLTEATQPAQLPAPPTVQNTAQQVPQSPGTATASFNQQITSQQIVDFFEQKKNITSQVSQTLSELSSNPTTIVSNPREVIQAVMQETQYSREIPKNELSQRFLSAIKDYETALTYQSPVRAGTRREEEEPQEPHPTKSGEKHKRRTEEERMHDYMKMFVDILKNQPGVVINNTAVANAQSAIQNQIGDEDTKTKLGHKVTAKTGS